MNESITYRSYQNTDFDAIAAIIRQAWKYDAFTDEKTAAKMAKVFLRSCLAEQTFSQVVLIDGVPKGIILVKNTHTHKHTLWAWLKRSLSILSLLLTKEGRSLSKIFGSVTEIDKELLERCADTYGGEIVFFAVNASLRGKGIGKQLFAFAMEYLRAENIHDYYLFTDTSCTYQFYDRQGLTRRWEKAHTFLVKEQVGNMTFFLYEGQCCPLPLTQSPFFWYTDKKP